MTSLQATQDKVLAVLQSVSGIVERRRELPFLRKTLAGITNGFPEAGGGGAFAADVSCDDTAEGNEAPEAAASDDDDGGDGDGEDDWRRPSPQTSPPSNGPAPLKRGIARKPGTRKAATKQTQPIDAMLWRLPTVLSHVPVSRSSWFAGVKAGRYPKPVQLGARAVAWRAEDIRTLVSSFSLK